MVGKLESNISHGKGPRKRRRANGVRQIGASLGEEKNHSARRKRLHKKVSDYETYCDLADVLSVKVIFWKGLKGEML